MSVFEYTFAPDDPKNGPLDAPRTIAARTPHDAIQILFLRELWSRGVAGTVRVRRWRSRDRWIVQRYDPRR